jgi:hypothetical protein
VAWTMVFVVAVVIVDGLLAALLLAIVVVVTAFESSLTEVRSSLQRPRGGIFWLKSFVPCRTSSNSGCRLRASFMA